MTFEELLEHASRLGRGDKLRLREWLDQQLTLAESELRGSELSLGSEVREMRVDSSERDYLQAAE